MLLPYKLKIIILIVFVFSFVFISSEVHAASAGFQKCIQGSSCSIGEYLYDDSYDPILDATCTLTSKNPDGSSLLNAASMTLAPQNDGWYAYSFDTTGMGVGVYRSQMTCVTNGETLRIDKSFSVEEKIADSVWNATASAHTETGSFGEKLQNSVLGADDIWNYPSRTLSSFGSLISDIWNYSSRSLTDFGTLIADVWSNTTRTLTGAGLDNGESLATKSDVDTATSSATTSIKGSGNKDLTQLNTGLVTAQASLDSIEGKVDTLNTNVDAISADTTSILSKWGSYSMTDLVAYVDTLETNLGTNADNCAANTVFGGIRCVRDKWGSNTAEELYLAANNAATYSAALRSELDYNGKSSTAFADIQAIKTYAQTLNTNVGNPADNSSASTVFGKIQGTREDVASSTTSIKGPGNKSLSDVSTEVAGVATTATSISNTVDGISTTVDGIDTKADTILTKWGSYNMADLMAAVNAIDAGNLGNSSDTCLDNTIFGQVNCIKGKWGSRTADDLYNTAVSTETKIDNLRTELDYNGKSTTAYDDMQSIITDIASMQSKIGTSADNSAQNTLYGKLKLNKETIENLDTSGAGLSDLLAKWGDYSASDIITEVNSISTDISVSNTVPGVSDILSLSQANASDLQSLKNSVLALQALTEANKTLLENGTKSPVIQTWLEEGSIIFKTLITNPTSVRQTVPVKFYLPKEATDKDVMKIDDGLKIEYDASEDAYYASGQVVLNANESQIYAVEVQDIWKISDEEINSLKLQAKEIYAPLKGTSYFGQGATLYADIVVSLDSASRLQKEAVTPEQRIKAYREAKVQVEKAKTEINDLKTLGTSASSAGSLFGFVGGVQTIAVWGLVIILLAGFTFLGLYMRLLFVGHHKTKKDNSNFFANYFEPITEMFVKLDSLISKKILVFMLILIVILGLIFAVLMFSLKVFDHDDKIVTTQIAGEKVKPMVDAEKHKGEEVNLADEKSVLGAATMQNDATIVASTSGVNLREGPSTLTKVLKRLVKRTPAKVINEKEGWYQVEYSENDNLNKGWIKQDFILLNK